MPRRPRVQTWHSQGVGDTQIVRARYEAAVDELAGELQRDRQVVAIALFGSLAYDVVWERSDIDLIVVVADQAGDDPGRGMLCYGGVNVHAQLMTRDQFKRARAGAMAGSQWDSIYETSRLLFSRDTTIDALFEQERTMGGRDIGTVLLRNACQVVPILTKAQKWLIAKGDLEYASLWALFAVQRIAYIDVVRHGVRPNRETVLQALELNPDLFNSLYFDLLNKKKTRALVGDRIDRIDNYLRANGDELFAPVLNYLADHREPVSAADIEHHFQRRHQVPNAVFACEYLADSKVIEKTSLPVRLTRRSTVEVEGLAFMYLPDV
jgi:uncharacterized protein